MSSCQRRSAGDACVCLVFPLFQGIQGTVQGKHLDIGHKDLIQERWGIHDGDADPDYIFDLLVPDDWLGHFRCNCTL